MAVGDEAKVGVRSYVALAPETTYGTNAIASSASTIHPFVATNIGIKTEFATQKLDALTTQRGFTRQVQLDKMVTGPLEGHLHAEESALLLINGMGGAYTFNSATGAGIHSISAGNFVDSTDTITSLSINSRKGESTVFQYTGGVVNNLKLAAAVGEAVKITCEMVCQDATHTTIDLSTVLSFSVLAPFTYVNGTYRYDSTEGSLTSSVAEAIQSFELEINNNLVTDAGMRQLGSRLLSGQPAAPRREVNLKVTQRFDTTTSYDRMTQNTAGAAQLFFSGASITSEYNRELTITLPNVRMKNTEPLVEGANEVIQSEIEFDVIVSGNPGTSTSREIGMTLQNSRTTAY